MMRSIAMALTLNEIEAEAAPAGFIARPVC